MNTLWIVEARSNRHPHTGWRPVSFRTTQRSAARKARSLLRKHSATQYRWSRFSRDKA